MWNDRFQEFLDKKVYQVLWKDAQIDQWKDINRNIFRHIKLLSKLDITSQAAIISRIIYKHQNQMRRDKPFQHFKIVNRLLNRFMDINIVKHLNFYRDITNEIQNSSKQFAKSISLPTKEFTIYLLERVLGLSKIAVKVIVACQEAFVSLDSHMRYGFFVTFNLFAIASVSRIWRMFQDVLYISMTLYLLFKNILSTLHHSTESYPESINDWLKNDLCNVYVITNTPTKPKSDDILNRLIEVQNNAAANLSNSSINIKAGPEKLKPDEIDNNNATSSEILKSCETDIGEPLSLSDFLSLRGELKKESTESEHLTGLMDANVIPDASDNSFINITDKNRITDLTITANRVNSDISSFVANDVAIDVLDKSRKQNNGPSFLTLKKKVGSIYAKKTKKRRLKVCPLCGNYIRKLTPSLAKNMKRSFSSTSVLSYNFGNCLKSRLQTIKHALLHSADVNETRTLSMYYRQLKKQRRWTVK